MIRLPVSIAAVVLFLTIAIPPLLQADTTPSGEKQKIELLIKSVGEMKEAKFVRNGTDYDAKTAATFLRHKWKANNTGVKTARDFIEKVASMSGTSGEPYLIRFKDGKAIKSRDFLLAELNRIEKISNPQATGTHPSSSTNSPPK